MLTATPSISDYLWMIKENDSLKNFHIEELLNGIINSIKNNNSSSGNPNEKVQDDLFVLRMEVLRFLSKTPEAPLMIEKAIAEEILIKRYTSSNIMSLSGTVAECLDVYYKIFAEVSHVMEKGIKEATFTDTPELTFRALKSFFYNIPELSFISKFLEASINFDYSLIVADLIINGKIRRTESEIEDLKKLMKNSITEYGAIMASYFKFWVPNSEDEEQLIRNIKIEIAKMELEQGKGIRVSQNELKDFISTN